MSSCMQVHPSQGDCVHLAKLVHDLVHSSTDHNAWPRMLLPSYRITPPIVTHTGIQHTIYKDAAVQYSVADLV